MDTKTITKLLESAILQIETAKGLLSSEDASPNETATRKAEQGICLYCEKPIEGKVTRGLHYNCYVRAKRLIDDGKTTEQQLVREGRLLPPSPGGRKRDLIPFEQSLGLGAQRVAEPQPEETKAVPSKPPSKPKKRKPPQR